MEQLNQYSILANYFLNDTRHFYKLKRMFYISLTVHLVTILCQ